MRVGDDMPFVIIRNDITKMSVDVIVNSTTDVPFVGPGVDAAVHQAAGANLFIAREQFGVLNVAEAILTKGFELVAPYVMHVVGPRYIEGSKGERDLLYQTYENALNLAVKHEFKSIAIPLISAGSLKFPRGIALEVALQAINACLLNHDLMIYLVVYDKASYLLSLEKYDDVQNYILDNFENEELIHENDDECMTINKMASNIYFDQSMSEEDLFENMTLSFQEMLFKYIDKLDLDDVLVYKKANIDRKLFSKIKSNVSYKPSKMTAISFAIALELTLDEAIDFLASAGYALSMSSKFDVVIKYFIERHIYDFYEINQVLFTFNQKTLGGVE